MNRKFDRFRQWAGERMGNEVRTNLSDDFKAMETEMNVRHEGLDRIHKALASYLKSISKRSEGDDKEKTLPIGHLGTSMVTHGEDFDAYSEYGRCLTMFGRTEERIARVQESYIAQANATWLESLDRSMTQMKDYQNARKKLDNRRLAYDTSLSKMQKAKKEDYRVEEELRTQKVKYEESNDDVCRRMQDVKETEGEGIIDMAAFLDAQLKYHEQCTEALLQLKNEWPGGKHGSPRTPNNGRRIGRTRSNTAHSYHERFEPLHEENANTLQPTPIVRSSKPALPDSPVRDPYAADIDTQRPVVSRTSTFEGPTQLRQEPVYNNTYSSRTTSENLSARISQLRPVSRVASDPYTDHSDNYSTGTSPDGYYGERSSPTPSYGNDFYQGGSSMNGSGTFKKAPPPPPPSRAKKPPPPPPPMKRPVFAGGAY